VRSENMTVFALPNAVGSTRLGITATRRVGGAVHRNRFKRVLRELFRLHRDALGEGLDIVVNAHPGAHLAPFAVLEQEFLNAFARLARRRAP
jgi:ribonuclease P protein component